MAITTLIYNNLLEKQNDGSLPDLEVADALGVRLLQVDDDGDDTTQRSRATMTDVMASAATVLSSTGYTDNMSLTGVTVTRDDAGNVVNVGAADHDFGALTQATTETIVAAVVFLAGANDGVRIPLWKVTATGADIVTPNGEKFWLRLTGGVLWRSGQGTLA